MKPYTLNNSSIPGYYGNLSTFSNKHALFVATLFVGLTSLPNQPATAAPIYKVTDNNGKVIFTDRPDQHQATASDITAISLTSSNNGYPPSIANTNANASSDNNSFSVVTTVTSAQANTTTASNQTPRRYQLSFTNPNKPRPYRRPAQNIDISISVTPTLDAADTVEILLDGQQVAQGLTASIPTLELNPGEHTLTAQIVSNGNTTSQVSQTVYVIQNNLAVQKQRALQRKKAVYDSLPWHQKLYFNLRQDNPFADVAK